MDFHSEVDKRRDAFGHIRIPKCSPRDLRIVAEKLMDMMAELDYNEGDYNTMTELDKKLTVDYWIKYNQLNDVLVGNRAFKNWYLKATEASVIERAIRWLVYTGHYIFPKESVVKNARLAAEHYSKAVKSK